MPCRDKASSAETRRWYTPDVQIRELEIPDAYEVTPVVHRDDRGEFLEWYRFDRLEETVGHSLDLRQGNLSVSRRGAVRGVHFADVPRGQAKYVTVAAGSAIDFVIDIRVGSPTFGHWDSVLLDTVDRRAVYVAEGLGHAVVSLTDDTVLSYLVSDVYSPGREHDIDPLDPELGLEFGLPAAELLLSPKDTAAPGLRAAADAGLLPKWDDCRGFYASLNGGVR
ncbi:MAG: dTDP-4-dehydrorhamnose 3,5-epimerase [Microbacteriaceae bacterium]|nr:dTDP-4-dehydrorhamnose 3,5-epimerase [Microbacteriaceae bacterium]